MKTATFQTGDHVVELPAPVHEFLMASGAYDEVNRRTGLCLDHYEEETIDPKSATTAADVLERFPAERFGSKPTLRVRVATQLAPAVEDQSVELAREEVAAALAPVVALLRRAAASAADVEASL